MTSAPPFLSTADRPIEFIPPSQDAEGYKLKRTAELKKAEQALDRRIEEHRQAVARGEVGAEEAEVETREFDDERESINFDWREMDRQHKEILEAYPTPQTFFIAVPTSVEREQINSRLISLGLTQVTQEMIRATMVEEIFHQDWAEPGEVLTPDENLARAEENANFLDSVWMRQEAHDHAIKLWQEQEVERMLDERDGAPARPRAEAPPKIIGIREQARMQLLVDRMMNKSQRLRDLAAANMDFGRRNAVLLIRMHLVGVENLEPTIPLERNRHTRALSEEAVLALREQINDKSWNELVEFIDKLYRVDGGERKNSGSRLEKPLLPNGSIELSASLATSDGNSTISSTTPAPAAESGMTTEPSSSSTSASGTAPASTLESGSQTAGL